QVACSQVVQVVVSRQGAERTLLVHAHDAAAELAQRPPELDRSAGGIAMPERSFAGLAWRRRDDDLLRGYALDAPGAGAEHECLARAALIHHLLVQLAHARAAFAEKH